MRTIRVHGYKQQNNNCEIPFTMLVSSSVSVELFLQNALYSIVNPTPSQVSISLAFGVYCHFLIFWALNSIRGLKILVVETQPVASIYTNTPTHQHTPTHLHTNTPMLAASISISLRLLMLYSSMKHVPRTAPHL